MPAYSLSVNHWARIYDIQTHSKQKLNLPQVRTTAQNDKQIKRLEK